MLLFYFSTKSTDALLKVNWQGIWHDFHILSRTFHLVIVSTLQTKWCNRTSKKAFLGKILISDKSYKISFIFPFTFNIASVARFNSSIFYCIKGYETNPLNLHALFHMHKTICHVKNSLGSNYDKWLHLLNNITENRWQVITLFSNLKLIIFIL